MVRAKINGKVVRRMFVYAGMWSVQIVRKGDVVMASWLTETWSGQVVGPEMLSYNVV